jgi:uncharacterized protein (DUF885 family)
LKKLSLLLLLFVALVSCDRARKNSIVGNAPFNSFKGRFIEALWRTYPGWANSSGNHKYDSILIIPDAASREREKKFCDNYLDSLHQYLIDSLDAGNKIDDHLIENQLQSALWNLKEFKEYEWNPSAYNVGESFSLLLSENYAPLDRRLESFRHRLLNVPAYYKAARSNINRPTQEHTELAIQQNKGSIDVFETSLPEALKTSGLPENEKQEILNTSKLAVQAIKDYISWLETEVLPSVKAGKGRSFRIGKELYEKKFSYDLQSGYTAGQIYQKALKREEELHTEMAKRATELWPKYFGNKAVPTNRLELIRKVLDTLAATHANRDSFQLSVEKQLPQLMDFIRRKDLLYIDPSKPLVVRQTPEYKEGFSVASIDAPGPYDKAANTYYNVGSLRKKTPPEAESFLREYNKYTLQIINIHEAIPGHYTQLVYSNQSPSIIKTILGSGAMVEGWAVYTERMMMEEGYGDNDPALWLMYYKWHLRSVCNTILDYGIQVNNMSEQEAMQLLKNEAFQEEDEARGKWRRASLSQVQLCSYFTGYSEIYDLREELKQRLGLKFNLRKFHEKFLSYGSAPVKYIREMMLADPEFQK